MVDTFQFFFFVFFFYFSELKLNVSKCEITGFISVKVVQVAVRGTRCVDLNKDTLKILGIHFSYNEQRKLQEEKSFYATVTNLQQIMKIWKIRNLIVEGKNFYF